MPDEVFLDDVLVPFANRVGEENEGWAVAKLLMRFARANNTTSGQLRRTFRRAARIVESHGGVDARTLRTRLRELEIRLSAFEALELRTLCETGTYDVPAVQASMVKTLATELHQKIATLALEAAGQSAIALPPADTTCSQWLDEGCFASMKYFATRAASIYSGTNETHRNLIANNLLS